MAEQADLSKLEIRVVNYQDPWQDIKDDAMHTIGLSKGRYPDSLWKIKMLTAEHSPIRHGVLAIDIKNCPQFVIGHLVRHHVGVTPFVQSLRYDRTEYEDDKIPNRNTLQNARFLINYQAFIDISKKRLCSCASAETHAVWQAVLREVAKYEPELANLCVPSCVYRGFCPERFEQTCKYADTEHFIHRVINYRKYAKGEI